VQGALARLEGLIRADADHRTGRVRVRFDEAQLSEDDVKERIRASGYEVV
jgi:copper chaperone CopZ